MVTIVGLNYQPEPTGIARYTTGLAHGLVQRGHNVRVISGYPHYPAWRIYDGYSGRTRKEDDDGVALTRVRHPVPAKPAMANRLFMELAFGLRALTSSWGRADAAILVSPALISTGIAGIKARMRGIPYAVWVQDIYTLAARETADSGMAARALRSVERRVLGSADSVVVIHDRFKSYLVSELGIAPEKIVVVRNWTHLTDNPREDRESVRARRGWAPDDVIALHAGNIGAKQGLENVVHASRIAARAGSSVRFVILGDGNQRAKLEAMGANANLEFIDPLGDIEFESTLAAADVLLVNELAGMTEMSVPSKLTSYFATGVPVVAATDASSTTADEVLAAGAGPRVDPDDPAALVNAIEQLAADPAQARRYGESALHYRHQVLGADTAIDLLRGVVAGLARTHPLPSPVLTEA
ncbi:hypothetical protein ASF30_14000 [Leifsonia sp. Leaf264]|nr:hypothetical protein ASF30_14000 [Leifsonia sp. Leaf264]